MGVGVEHHLLSRQDTKLYKPMGTTATGVATGVGVTSMSVKTETWSIDRRNYVHTEFNHPWRLHNEYQRSHTDPSGWSLWRPGCLHSPAETNVMREEKDIKVHAVFDCHCQMHEESEMWMLVHLAGPTATTTVDLLIVSRACWKDRV